MVRFQRFVAICLAVGLAGCAAGTALAQSGKSDWASVDEARVRLVAATRTTGEADRITAGIHVMLQPGWKTYWRTPGIGLPPAFSWQDASQNVADVEWAWPAPQRFEYYGMFTNGYEREVVFPLEIVLAGPGEAATLSGEVELELCKDICIRESFPVTLALPAGEPRRAPYAGLIRRYQRQVPRPGGDAGLDASASWGGSAGAPALVFALSGRDLPADAQVFVETTPQLSAGAPVVAAGDGTLGVTLPVDLPLPEGVTQGTALPAMVTIVAGDDAWEMPVTVAP